MRNRLIGNCNQSLIDLRVFDKMIPTSTPNAKPQSSGPLKEPEQPKIAKERANLTQTASDLPKNSSSEQQKAPLQNKQKETANLAADTVRAGRDLGSGAVKDQFSAAQPSLAPSLP